MIQFFVVYLYDDQNNEQILFSNADGSPSPIVILDDGWAPNIAKYVRDGEKTWSDVVEELECMTNVATRDEALALIEKLNALIHRAARDIEEKQQYTVRFHVQSQFSNAPNSAFTFVLSPPDDGNVITLSTDIQTAPPGQIKFKLRFKRTGEWITTFNDINKNFYLQSYEYNYRGVWVGSTVLNSYIQIPTPISLTLKPVSNNNGQCTVENLFLCSNVSQHYVLKNFSALPYFNFTEITYPSSMYAQNDKGYLIQSNAVPYSTIPGPFSDTTVQPGIYAIFISWRSVQNNVSHLLKLRFNEDLETNSFLLLSNNTYPKLTFLGTVTLVKSATTIYLMPKIGHSTGFEIEKIILVKLKQTSSIINIQGLLSNFLLFSSERIAVKNTITQLNKLLGIVNDSYQLQRTLFTHESLDTVADNQSISIVMLGHSPAAFSLRAWASNYYTHVHSWNTGITYRPIRTTFH